MSEDLKIKAELEAAKEQAKFWRSRYLEMAQNHNEFVEEAVKVVESTTDRLLNQLESQVTINKILQVTLNQAKDRISQLEEDLKVAKQHIGKAQSANTQSTQATVSADSFDSNELRRLMMLTHPDHSKKDTSALHIKIRKIVRGA